MTTKEVLRTLDWTNPLNQKNYQELLQENVDMENNRMMGDEKFPVSIMRIPR